MNTEISPGPRRNAWPSAMADVLWDKQTLTPFCLGGKDLAVPRQSLQRISFAAGSFCILLKIKTAEDGLLHGLWSAPLPQTADVGKPAMSFRLPRELLDPSWRRASAMKNYGVSELGEQMVWASHCWKYRGSWLKPSSERAEVLQEELAMCCGVGAGTSRAWMLNSQGWQIWEFLNENNSLCWCFCSYCIQENGPWVKFFLPFWGG